MHTWNSKCYCSIELANTIASSRDIFSVFSNIKSKRSLANNRYLNLKSLILIHDLIIRFFINYLTSLKNKKYIYIFKD